MFEQYSVTSNWTFDYRLDFKLDQCPEELVIRHDYDPIKRVWNKHEIIIKIESEPFGNGSMRRCFRLCVSWILLDEDSITKISRYFFRKKLEKYSSNRDWDSARNCVAKRYLNDVPHIRYFDDVMMQMMTKLWAEHYNRHHPPKKVSERDFELFLDSITCLFFILGGYYSNERFRI